MAHFDGCNAMKVSGTARLWMQKLTYQPKVYIHVSLKYEVKFISQYR